ncbi:MAG: aspartate--tRNA ligase [Vicinamibacteria bacterium]|nr:aspartate--tRNA ligase [Vicinamibacteria bacterium]
MKRTHYCGSVDVSHVGQTVTLMGWAATRRDLGGVVFIDLRDREGICQVVARPEVSKAAHDAADKVRGEYVLAVTGRVDARDKDTVNPKIKTGAIEITATEILILSEAKTPPFAIEDDITTSEDIRLKYRYLDMRRGPIQKSLILRHKLALAIRTYLDQQGFLEIETPILTASTPEGARDYLVPSRVHHGSFFALPQSPQMFKQLCMVGGLDRYFQIARCFRDEDLRADRQPEFTQVDIELSFPHEEAIFELIEPLYQKALGLIGVEVPRPFPRLAYKDAMLRFGSDKPDLRFGMEISDITEEMRTLGLEGFPAAIEAGAVARAIVLPAAVAPSGTRLRKINEELWLTRIVPDARASKRNLFTLKYTDEAISNLIKKGASEEVARKIFAKTGAQKDDTILVGVDAEGPIAMAMGILRLEMGRELKLIDEKAYKFLWIVDFPLFEWDAGEKRFYSVNHPFTAVLPEDAHMLDSEPGKVRAKAYDIVLNGMEVGGGSYRIHDSATQAKVFKILGLTDEETRDRFGFFIDALSYGTPPHGGIALGLDRLAMLLSGAGSLRDVIAFPKTASATDLMCNAPSKVRPDQLRDLGILLSRQ